MFLIFQLGRLDVWPVGDLAVRKGYGTAWGLAEPADPQGARRLRRRRSGPTGRWPPGTAGEPPTPSSPTRRQPRSRLPRIASRSAASTRLFRSRPPPRRRRRVRPPGPGSRSCSRPPVVGPPFRPASPSPSRRLRRTRPAPSGLALRHGVTCLNAPGLIDAGYRDEIRVILVNHDPSEPFKVEVGDRIAQLVIQSRRGGRMGRSRRPRRNSPGPRRIRFDRPPIYPRRTVPSPSRSWYVSWHADVAQLVEHNLAKVGVAGSNPVVRSGKQQVRGPRGPLIRVWAEPSGRRSHFGRRRSRPPGRTGPSRCCSREIGPLRQGRFRVSLTVLRQSEDRPRIASGQALPQRPGGRSDRGRRRRPGGPSGRGGRSGRTSPGCWSVRGGP